MTHAAYFGIVLAAAVAATWPATFANAEQASPLAAVEADMRKAYPNVANMRPADLVDLEASGKPVVLLDARTDAEFGVSRIAGAQHVDPRISATEFQSRFGADLEGKTVVIYCAVGGRSSDLANRIDKVARQAGAAGVYNMEGGIFRWHNEKRPLTGPSGATDEVHPFSANAARLIERQEGVAYRPGTSKSAKEQ
jgi:rhodanese-related sulfurtransferase